MEGRKEERLTLLVPTGKRVGGELGGLKERKRDGLGVKTQRRSFSTDGENHFNQDIFILFFCFLLKIDHATGTKLW